MVKNILQGATPQGTKPDLSAFGTTAVMRTPNRKINTPFPCSLQVLPRLYVREARLLWQLCVGSKDVGWFTTTTKRVHASLTLGCLRGTR